MTATTPDIYRRRMQEITDGAIARGIDAVALTAGPDLTWACGYAAMPLERITMLVLGPWRDPVLIVPLLEAARVDHEIPVEIVTWRDGEDAMAVCARELRRSGGAVPTVAVDPAMTSRDQLALRAHMPYSRIALASTVTAELRSVKSGEEVAALAAAADAIDSVVESYGDLVWIGRSEADIGSELAARILDVGHEKVNFVIVASGPNGASPHHDTGDRVVQPGDVVLCDIGGTMNGYCSDISRCVAVGDIDADIERTWEILTEAQEAAFQAVQPGARASSVDLAARQVLEAAGMGDAFLHRTGHGIGRDAHEEPWIVTGNVVELRPGMCFSIEPGVYFPGRYGLRLEDIVTVTSEGGRRLNQVSRDLIQVEG